MSAKSALPSVRALTVSGPPESSTGTTWTVTPYRVLRPGGPYGRVANSLFAAIVSDFVTLPRSASDVTPYCAENALVVVYVSWSFAAAGVSTRSPEGRTFVRAACTEAESVTVAVLSRYWRRLPLYSGKTSIFPEY